MAINRSHSIDSYPLDNLPVDGETMNHLYSSNGDHFVEIHCGCCGQYFWSPAGGTAFCQMCIQVDHDNCKVPEIMGLRG